jgi:hypothetical protein
MMLDSLKDPGRVHTSRRVQYNLVLYQKFVVQVAPEIRVQIALLSRVYLSSCAPQSERYGLGPQVAISYDHFGIGPRSYAFTFPQFRQAVNKFKFVLISLIIQMTIEQEEETFSGGSKPEPSDMFSPCPN